MRRSRFAALAVLAFLSVLRVAQAADVALPAGVAKAVSLEGITEYRLDNGLKVLLFPDASKPTVTVNVTYLVGSRHENYGETGMAHLLEHMLFKGTPRNPAPVEQFNRHGARWNATTSFDRTNYFEIFPSTAENLRWALAMEADRMVNSSLARADLDAEMTVVRNEYERGENAPAAVLAKRMQSVAFDWHNYRNATIGNRSDIENVAIDNLRAFYRTYYQPDNAVLLVAGKFDEAAALQIVAESFAPLPRPARALPRHWTVEPAQDGERTFAVRRPGDVQLVMVSYKVPGALHADAEAFSVAAHVLGSAPAGRLHKALVETGKATNVAARPSSTLEPGLASFVASVRKDGSLEDAQRALIETVEGLAGRPPTAEEMQRAAALSAKLAEQVWSSPESFAVALSEMIALGDWRLFFYARDRAQKITAGEVAAAADRYLRADNRTVGVFIPTDNPRRAELPAAPAAADVLKDFVSATATAAVGEAFDPSPANIDARTTLRQLSGGMKVALLPKKTRGATVNVNLVLRWGDPESLAGKSATANLVHLMMARGSSRYTRQQISDRFDRLKISGSVTGNGARFRTTRENLSEALRLIAHLLKEPAFPQAEFEQAKRQVLGSLEQRRGDPGAQAAERLSRHYNPYPRGDSRYVPTTGEAIEDVTAVTLADLKAFHREFLGASHGEIAIVGDFDAPEALAVLEEELGAWKSPRPYARVTREYREIPPISATIETAGKASAVFAARMNLKLRDDDPLYPEYPALALANYMLGGGAGMGSRLAQRIRGAEGLSYSVSTSLASNSLDPVSTFGAIASVAPQNMEKLEQIFREELLRAVRDGFSDAEVEAAKTGLLQARTQARAQDEIVANAWADKLQRGTTWAEAADYDARLQALTRAEVHDALKKHLDVSRMSVVRAGTFAPTQ